MNALNPSFASLLQPVSSCLQLEQIAKHFGDFTALHQIDLQVEEGEFICFLGPSGCGKTTLLRAIAGLEPQSAGRMLQQGRDITHLPPEQRDFGIVFQSYALFPNLSVFDNIAYGLRNQRQPKARIQQRVQELLELIGLEAAVHQFPAQLSGGQQQRVALARALATEPSLLLLDEPLSALDACVRVHLRQQLKKLQRDLGVTTIMVTHDQEEALTLADRIVVMNQGRIEQIGTPQEIYQRPANAFVASFVGRMNLLTVEVISDRAIRLGEQQIDLSRAHGVPVGEQACLAIRPEAIQLQPPTDQVAYRLQARVNEVEFLGAFVRLHLVLTQHQAELQLDLPLGAGCTFQPQTRLDLYWPQDQLQVFAGEAR